MIVTYYQQWEIYIHPRISEA